MKEIKIVSCRLQKDAELSNGYQIKNPNDAIRLIIENFNDLEKENLFVINCDRRLKPTSINIVSVGTENATLINPQTFFRTAIITNSSAVFMLHNHPSDNLTPSKHDEKTYKTMQKAGKILGIEVKDSLIFNYEKEYYSCTTNKIYKLDKMQYSNNKGIDFSKKLERENESMEDLYKRVCMQYTETKTYDMVIEDNGQAINIVLSDENLDIRDKITAENYKKLLSEDEIYPYENFESYYKDEVEFEIKRDIEDLRSSRRIRNMEFLYRN